MMEIYRTRIDTIRNYNLDPNEVIKGLNGYYESDKRNGYITVMRNDYEGPAYFTAALYLSALIEWLREDHDIFYYPGMDIRDSGGPGLILDQVEAARNAAKTCCLRAHIKDEISKRGLWCDKDADIPELVDTLFKAYDECKELRDINRKDAVKLSEENRELKESVCKDIMNYIRYEASRNGFELPEEIDGEPLTIKRVFHDLLELMRKRGAEIRGLKSGIEDLKEHITLLEADLKKAKMEKEKFLIEVADREEEIESLQNKDYDVYLEHRRYIINSIMFVIRQEASRNGFSLPEKIDGEQLSIERTFHDLIELLMKRTADVEEARKKHWNDLRDIHKALGRDGTCDSIDGFAKAVKARAEYVESLSRNAEREAQKSDTNKLIRECCTKHDIVVPSRYLSDEACIEYLFSMVEDYKLKLKDYILKDIEEHGYRYDGLQTKSIEEIVDWIITMATSDHSFIVLKDIYTTVVSPAERLRYKDCDRPTVDHMKDYILRRFEGLHANIEYCLKKMSELDGHKKNFEILKEKQEFLSKQNMELSCKLCAKDDEISRLKDLINAMNEEVKDM